MWVIQEYIKENRQKEELIIQFNPVNEIDTIIEVKNPKRDTKFKRLLNKWKKEEEEKKKVEFEIDYGENRLKITADGGATHCVRLYDAKKLLGLI